MTKFRRKKGLKILKMFAITAALLMVLSMVPRTMAVPGSQCQFLQYKFYANPGDVFNALLANDIDLMGWPLSAAQYAIIAGNKNIQVAPVYELSDYEIAFNNNATDPSHPFYGINSSDPNHPYIGKAMNQTAFRQAVACLVDKDGLIAGPAVNALGVRKDTPIPRPILNAWVNFGDSKYGASGNPINNYPWDYSETHALTILWNNGWYPDYPTLFSLLLTSLPLPPGSCKYPVDTSGGTGYGARTGTTIDPLVYYIRNDDPSMLAAGDALVYELTRIGVPTNAVHGNSVLVYSAAFVNHDYDIATLRWTDDRFPLWFWTRYTPIGIYPGGPNAYMIQDWNLTYWAYQEYPNATSIAQSMNAALFCQDIIVQNAMFVTLYTPISYIAYRNAVGVIDFRGYGLIAYLEYTWMNMRVSPFAPPMTIRYGTPYPPYEINPIFSPRAVFPWDYEVIDSMFDTPMMVNPYNPTVPGKSPAGSDQPWLAYDWNYELSNFTGWANNLPQGGSTQDPYGTTPSVSYTNCANITFWFRHDITWQDDPPLASWPLTVDDYNYTLSLDYTYGDSWYWSDMQFIVNFVKIDDYTCSIYCNVPSFWVLYNVLVDIIPKHIYQYITIPAGAGEGSSTTGHHGYWPGADSIASEILPSAPFTYAQLTGSGGEQYTWIGTGIWQYVPGTSVPGAGGGALFSAYPHFWQNVARGDIDFKYYWDNGPSPQGGRYRVSLSDLVLLAMAWATNGNPPKPLKLGGQGVWEPGCDLAAPSCVIGLSDLVTLAISWGNQWGVINTTGYGVPIQNEKIP